MKTTKQFDSAAVNAATSTATATATALATAAATAILLTASASAHAGLFDSVSDAVGSVVKSKSESAETMLVYDLAGFSGTRRALLEAVRTALTYHGDNANVNEDTLEGDAPAFPGKLTLKQLGLNFPIPVNIRLPQCEGSAFSISSSDMSMAGAGDSARYMACGFRYTGGFRVSFYAAYTETSGGAMGLLTGATIGKAVVKAAGLKSAPQDFINASIAKMEEKFGQNGWAYTIVEMRPAIEGKVVSADPIQQQRVAKLNEGKATEAKSAERGQRLTARGELRKLGYDAADASQFRKAITSGDGDVVALFVEAGAIDPGSADETGTPFANYATKPGVKAMLVVKADTRK